LARQRPCDWRSSSPLSSLYLAFAFRHFLLILKCTTNPFFFFSGRGPILLVPPAGNQTISLCAGSSAFFLPNTFLFCLLSRSLFLNGDDADLFSYGVFFSLSIPFPFGFAFEKGPSISFPYRRALPPLLTRPSICCSPVLCISDFSDSRKSSAYLPPHQPLFFFLLLILREKSAFNARRRTFPFSPPFLGPPPPPTKKGTPHPTVDVTAPIPSDFSCRRIPPSYFCTRTFFSDKTRTYGDFLRLPLPFSFSSSF